MEFFFSGFLFASFFFQPGFVASVASVAFVGVYVALVALPCFTYLSIYLI
jgi:hypothetical protein